MALPLGKLTILVGAGIVGSVLAKEGHISDFSNFVSGAFKIVLRQIRSSDSPPAVKKPHNDALMAQVNNLRQELQLLARDRTITIVDASGIGARRYGTIIIIVVVGYGYIWWKGWKLPDMMFATRRSLSNACTSIGNQLGKVYESIEKAKSTLTARIDDLDCGLDECAALTENTREEISVIQQQADTISGDFKSVRVAVHVLESKIKEIEGKQDSTNVGVMKLCNFAFSLENSISTERIQASPSSSSRPALELPPVKPARATSSGSSRPSLELESVTPLATTDTLAPNMSSDPPPSLRSAGAYQGTGRISELINFPSSNVDSNSVSPGEDKNNCSSSGLLGLRFPGISAPFLTRTRSATDAVLQHTRGKQ